MAIKPWSSRWVDTYKYKTLEILVFFVKRYGKNPMVPSNKARTSYEALCPIHHEKTPSFKVYQKDYDGWHYKCFGCGRHGDVFTFLKQTEGLQFWEALVLLRKTFPSAFNWRISFSKKQLHIPFPEDDNGNFIWVHPEMKQLGFQ
jgi:hypothetical protein